MALVNTVFLLLFLQLSDLTIQSKQNYFGTKTAYHQDISNTTLHYPNGCTPIHLDILLRHGSRFPSNGDREKIEKLLKKLSRFYNSSTPFRSKNLTIPWKTPAEWDNAKSSELSAVGEREHNEIAKRFRHRFSAVFDEQYWNKYYEFISRDKLRCSQSAMAFSLGLFQDDVGSLGRRTLKFQPVAISFAGKENDDKLLSSYDSCPRYKAEIDDHDNAEVEKFIKGPEVKRVITAIEERLKIKGKISLTFKDVEIVATLCAFGIMNRNDDSWCGLLSSEDLKVLNYADDMENYYVHSLGNDISYKIICALLGDMTDKMERFSKGVSDFRGVFRFTSSGTVFSLLTILGAFDDGTPLRADNFKQSENRKFPSNFVPMAANVALVLYKCNSTVTESKKHDYKVQVLVNEKQMALPCCQGNITCGLDEFLAYFNDTVENCNFNKMCALPYNKGGTPKASKMHSGIFLIAAFVLLAF